ncbi:GNAT family N-acetyltransferase [Candidatus Stoquefichus massiliensis]|uniref:GNAT family N-acetyltransferase n=1 Tax=Candidatus Stoquefichus massiliensis TaxID=1470350 RepID=UPI00048649A7|nr:GNAT family N-acetyltransferase [Candidatus Stoquefichus massiliensis]
MKIVDGSLYFDEIKKLIISYVEELQRDLSFQNLNDELEHLDQKYTQKNGRILVAIVERQVVGCVAYHCHNEKRCEMKRLYVLPTYRKQKIGLRLIENIIQAAKEDGYTEMVLDTILPLHSAIGIYKKLGFIEIPAYYDNPMNDVIYMKKNL